MGNSGRDSPETFYHNKTRRNKYLISEDLNSMFIHLDKAIIELDIEAAEISTLTN